MFIANIVIIIYDFSAMGDRNEILQTLYQIQFHSWKIFTYRTSKEELFFFSLKQMSPFYVV